MVNRIVVGADSFSIHGKFDEQGMFLLMEEGDILSDEDFARIVTFVDDHRNGDIFLLPKKYGPSRNGKKGIMYAPFSAYREKESMRLGLRRSWTEIRNFMVSMSSLQMV